MLTDILNASWFTTAGWIGVTQLACSRFVSGMRRNPNSWHRRSCVQAAQWVWENKTDSHSWHDVLESVPDSMGPAHCGPMWPRVAHLSGVYELRKIMFAVFVRLVTGKWFEVQKKINHFKNLRPHTTSTEMVV